MKYNIERLQEIYFNSLESILLQYNQEKGEIPNYVLHSIANYINILTEIDDKNWYVVEDMIGLDQINDLLKECEDRMDDLNITLPVNEWYKEWVKFDKINKDILKTINVLKENHEIEYNRINHSYVDICVDDEFGVVLSK